MLDVGEQVELAVEKLVYGGRGLGHLGKMAVFVSRTAPGDKIKVRIKQVRRDYAVGELVQVLDPSPKRVPPYCPYYEYCGGCQLQHLGYRDQLLAKVNQVRETLQRIGAVTSPPVQEILPVGRLFGYRNKAIYHCRTSKEKLLIGLVGLNRDEIVDLSHCPLQPDNSNHALAKIRDVLGRLISRSSLDPQVFRNLVIRTSEATGKV
ncbi:MAG: class I SAM-dependent RNA methyltransferase, partial [Candidatus Binatia bacterium]